jgi:hypothetical protein
VQLIVTIQIPGGVSETFKQHWCSRFLTCNVKPRNDLVATDTLFHDNPALPCGLPLSKFLLVDNPYDYGLKEDK